MSEEAGDERNRRTAMPRAMTHAATTRNQPQTAELIVILIGVFAVIALALFGFLIAPTIERLAKAPPSLAQPRNNDDRAAAPLATARLRTDLGEVFTEDFYPAAAKRAGIEGRTAVSLSIDRTGTVTACKVTQSSGNAEIDVVTCRLSVDRVRYAPARDGAGRPVASVQPLAVRWQLADE